MNEAVSDKHGIMVFSVPYIGGTSILLNFMSRIGVYGLQMCVLIIFGWWWQNFCIATGETRFEKREDRNGCAGVYGTVFEEYVFFFVFFLFFAVFVFVALNRSALIHES